MENRGTSCGRSLAFKEMREMNSCWRSVLHLGRKIVWPKGHRVPFGRELYFLDRGRVRLTNQNMEGVEKILWYIHEGCVFGETPFFDPMPAESYFSCATGCVSYAFTAEDVEEICKDYPHLLINLLCSMSRKLRVLSNQASSLYLDNVLARTCKFLAQHIIPGSDPLTADMGVSKQEMASLLGVHRISLYKILRQQEESGLFGPFSGKTVTILRPEEFFMLAES